MRTTVRLPDDLMSEVKQLAARTGRTMTAVIEDALREVLARVRSQKDSRRRPLPTFRGDGLAPGIDESIFESNASLTAILEAERDAALLRGYRDE